MKLIKEDHYVHVPSYEGEEMELAMRDYVKYPPMRVWGDCLKYITATINGKIFPWCHVKEHQAKEIYWQMRNYIVKNSRNEEECQRYMDGLDEMWPRLYKKMLNNRGLWKLMADTGASSLSFAKFPVDLVPRAIALESAFGINYDNAGVYQPLRRVTDISMRSAAVEPEFVELRRRAAEARKCILRHIPELANHTNTPSKEKLGTIITTGAGLLIELRKFGMTLAQLQSLRIIACDMDKSLLKELDTVFRHDFGISFFESGIEYHFCTIEELLTNESLYGTATVVLMDGILSYCQSIEQMQRYIVGAEKLRKPGGVIFCDLTVLDLTMTLLRCAVVDEWQSEDKNYAMHPELSAKSAVKKMQRICAQLGFEMRYAIDPRNPSPLGVIFWINDGMGKVA